MINKEYNYTVNKLRKNNVVTYTYEPKHIERYDLSFSNNKENNKIKSILSTIGMEMEFIDNLSDNALKEYANSNYIRGCVSYAKIKENNEIEYVLEKQASLGNAIFLENYQGISKNSNEESYTADYEDEYVRLYYLVSYLGDAKYKFSVDSRWIKMPKNRKIDFLGSAAFGITVENNTRKGYISYDKNFSYNYNPMKEETVFENIYNFNNAENGDWQGSGIKYSLPEDQISDGIYNVNDSFISHFEYVGKVKYPSLELNFNTTASHSHFVFKWFWQNLNINIGLNGVSTSISMSGVEEAHVRTAGLETSINYKP